MSTTNIIVALTVALLFFLGLVNAVSDANYRATHIDMEPLSAEDLCARIGELSGCSGCEHGTKGMCSWVARDASNNLDKRTLVFEDRAVQFNCVPTHLLGEYFAVHEDADLAGHICPADPKKEPMLRMRFAPTNLDEFEETSVVHSKFFDSDLVEWGTSPYAVDRTSFYGEIGHARLHPDAIERAFIDCAAVSTAALADVHDENGQESEMQSNLLNGVLVSDRDKRCVRFTLSQYLSSRCPAYGVAVSGICKSHYEAILRECTGLRPRASVGALRANGDGGQESKAIEAYHVVPDGTPYCLSDFPLKPSGHFEVLAGLNIPSERLRAMYCAGEGFEYDCDELDYSHEPCNLPLNDNHALCADYWPEQS